MLTMNRQRMSLDSFSVKSRIEATLNELEIDTAFALNSTFDKVAYLENLCSSLNRLLDHCPSDLIQGTDPVTAMAMPMTTPTETRPESNRTSAVRQEPKHSGAPFLENDASYRRVCHLLEHLISDASNAVRSEVVLEGASSDDWEEVGTPTDEDLPSTRSLSVFIHSEMDPSPYARGAPPLEEKTPYGWASAREHPSFAPGLSVSMYLDMSRPATIQTTMHLHSHSRILMSIAYWLLLFILGVVLLDRYLCKVSSQQVAIALDQLVTGRESLEIDPADYDRDGCLRIQHETLRANLRKALFRRKSF
ncbi:hypothetical protein K493DRAFT_355898 [Basidiobolus meristosporus CBS 931.73]|uniref:Uncharacterized protein n=1 Tax=Basidiobolus meristosporus CBS 931.73 TaxID=1314790 RepID=A0A1Y1XZM4_9FUNG|nr:hypothetical protein K493DRAFT_355898 [Basidiobolus meristosporus CBS 931.73]|eukprot:ORX91192.1 hypothetical protein K493DRAFT_355898 [Basidiobolus meristosporus CBS 931.73]